MTDDDAATGDVPGVLEPLLVSIDAACAALSISRGTMYSLMRQGTIPTVTIGSRRLLRVADVRSLARSNPGPGSESQPGTGGPGERHRRSAGAHRASEQPLLMSVDAACAALSISRGTMYSLMRQGTISTVTIGSRRLLPVADVHALAGDDRPATSAPLPAAAPGDVQAREPSPRQQRAPDRGRTDSAPMSDQGVTGRQVGAVITTGNGGASGPRSTTGSAPVDRPGQPPPLAQTPVTTVRPARQGNGSGSVYQRGDGRWVAAAYVICDDGVKRRKTKSVATRRDAEAALAALRQASMNGIPFPDQRLTVADYLTGWLARHTRKVAPRTATSYESIITKYLIPHLGHIPLVQLRPAHVDVMMGALIDAGLSARTVEGVHAVLRKALTDAYRHELVTRNVAKMARPPSPRPAPRAFFQPDQAQRFLSFVAGTRLDTATHLGLLQGVRLGEMLGLQWRHIDFDHDTIAITGQLQRVNGTLVRRDTKTGSSRRVLPLSPIVRHHLQAVLDTRGERPDLDDPVVASTTGTPWDPDNFTKLFKDTATEFVAGERAAGHQHTPLVTFHGLRHTYASIGLAADGDVKSVQETLGHSTALLTLNTYGHALSAGKIATVTGIGDAIARQPAVHSDDQAGTPG